MSHVRIAAALTIALAAPFAIADAPPTKLVYSRGAGAEACPEEAALRADVGARLGHDPFVDPADRTLTARIVKEGVLLRGSIELRDAAGAITGTRTLESKQLDCKELSAAMSLAIALALDPIAATTPKPSAAPSPSPSPSPSPTPSPSPSPSPTPAPTPSPTPSPPPPPPSSLNASIGVLGAGGFAPRSNVGFTAGVAYRTRRWSLGAEARRDLPVTSEHATSSILAVSLLPCIVRGPLGLCGIAALGAIQASGSDVTTPRSDTGLWAAVGVRLALELPIYAPIALGIHADGMAPLVRTSLRLSGTDVWTTPTFAAAVGLKIILHFE